MSDGLRISTFIHNPTELQMTEQKSTNPTSSFSQSWIAAMKNEESSAPQLNTDTIFAP